MSEPLVALEEAAVGYRGRAILSGIRLAVGAGDFLAMVGPNGGGKTTVLRTLLGALRPIAGRVVRPRPIRVGYVPQREQLDAIWPFSVDEVVLMGRVPRLGPLRRPGAGDRAVALRALARVGLEPLAGARYGELSGGQRQRALIARALAAEPELLALDEPANGMDPAAELSTMELLRELQAGGGPAVVMVSHRLESVAGFARSIAFVDRERGLFQVGPVAEMLRPAALEALYARPVAVREEEGRRFVVPSEGAGRGSGPEPGEGAGR